MDKLSENMLPTTRFAPSPNGPLHLGHAYAAIIAHDFARERRGRFLLRIEDIDGERSRPEHVEGILRDMEWLGLQWDGDPIFQSQRIASYQQAFDRLRAMGLAYRCFCSRRDIAEALKTRPVRHGPDGPNYPGTCRSVSEAEASRLAGNEPHSWRLDMAAAVELAGSLDWIEMERGRVATDAGQFGDIVLMRRDAPASYHLAATVDDAADGISHVVRGADLYAYTAIHRLLQTLLGLAEPVYHHHRLLMDGEQKLAKSRGSLSLKSLRDAGQDGRDLAARLRNGKLPSGISLSGP